MLALIVRAVPFEFQGEFFQKLYGVVAPGDTVVVDNIPVEKSTLDIMAEMRAKQQARRESRTEEGSEN